MGQGFRGLLELIWPGKFVSIPPTIAVFSFQSIVQKDFTFVSAVENSFTFESEVNNSFTFVSQVD
jgi:hypothetical protein